MAVNCDQFGFRIRLDATAAQGGTPVWAAAQNVNAPVLANIPFRIRIGVYNSGATATSNVAWNLRYSKNGGGYTQISTTAAGNPVYATDATAGASADDSNISTALLTPPGGSGAFSGGKYDFTGSVANAGVLGAGRVTEMEFGLALNSVVAVPSDAYTFEIYIASGSLQSYSQIPSLSLAKTVGASALMMGI